MHVPYLFPHVNILSPVSNMLLTLWDPRFHIYGVKRLHVPHVFRLDQDPTVPISPHLRARNSPIFYFYKRRNWGWL